MKLLLKLFLIGESENSRKAVSNLKNIIDMHLAEQCELEIIDVAQNPEQAEEAGVIATPTLIKQLPLPLRRIIGDMSDTSQVLFGLGVVESDIDDNKSESPE